MANINHRQIVITNLIARDGGSCAICGEPFKVYAPPQIDHRTPIMAGGLDIWENLQLVHSVCNQRKGMKPYRPNVTTKRDSRHKVADEAVSSCKGSMKDAAALLKVSVRTLYRWIK